MTKKTRPSLPMCKSNSPTEHFGRSASARPLHAAVIPAKRFNVQRFHFSARLPDASVFSAVAINHLSASHTITPRVETKRGSPRPGSSGKLWCSNCSCAMIPHDTAILLCVADIVDQVRQDGGVLPISLL